jgi:hypothetical protein
MWPCISATNPLVGPKPTKKGGYWDHQPSSKASGREFPSSGGLVSGCPAKAEELSGLLDRESDPVLEPIQHRSDSLIHVGTSL